MAREVESVHEFERRPKFGLAKTLTVVRCDDGTVYELERSDSRTVPTLTHGFAGTVKKMTHLRGSKKLPASVNEVLDEMYDNWQK